VKLAGTDITVTTVIYLHGWGNMKIVKREASDVENVVTMFDGIRNGSRMNISYNLEESITRCRRCGAWVYMSSDCEWCHKVAA
jgi:hypothetical protein